MAFILRFNNPLSGSGDQANLGSSIAMGAGEYFELDAVIPSSNPTSALVLTQDNSNWLGFNGTQAARGRIGGTFYTGTSGSMAPYLDVLTTYRFTRTATGYEITADGNLLLSFTNATQLTIARWGQGGTSSYVNMDFYEGRYYNSSGVLVHQWIPSGTGSTVLDSVGTNDLTLANFPTDDSQYIEYAKLTLDQSTATFGDTLTYTLGKITSPTRMFVTDSAGNEFDFTSVTTTGAIVPALAPNLAACLLESGMTVTITDGVDTATDVIQMTQPAGFALTTLTSVPPTPVSTDWVFGFDNPAVAGDQGFENSAEITHNTDGTITWTPQALSYTYYTIDATDGVISEINKTFNSEGGIGIPAESRTPPYKAAQYLRDNNSLEGSTNDVFFEWLGSQGYEGTLNERWMGYWASLGYTGAYNDRRYNWVKM